MTKKIVIESKDLEKKEPTKYSEELEKGNILFFPEIPFAFPEEEINFLLDQKQGASSNRKNIAYKPQLDKVTNHDTEKLEEKRQMHAALKNFSERTSIFLKTLLPAYAPYWKLDYASFRPFQEKGRKLRIRARNDLLHVDSFPTRPMHGSRILRFFININPKESRNWMTSHPFEELVQMYGGSRGVLFPKRVDHSFLERSILQVRSFLKQIGLLKQIRSPYDHFMLKMHNFLKENEDFQKNCFKQYWEFPPHSCWAVFTDQVSHAALSGQYALEQTLFVPQKALLFPDRSPLRVLERAAEGNMVYPGV